MNAQIKEILEELYLLDSSLKNSEIELVRIISKMIDSKPDTHFSESFKMELKNKIIKQINESKIKKPSFFDNLFRSFVLIASWAIMASFFIMIISPQIIWNKPNWNLTYNNLNKTNNNYWIKKQTDSIQKENTGFDTQVKEMEEIIDSTWNINNTEKNANNTWWQVIKNTIKNNDVNSKPIKILPKEDIKLVYVKINKVADNAFWSIKTEDKNPLWWWEQSSVRSTWLSSVQDNSDSIEPSTMSDSVAAPKMLNDSLIANEEINYIYSYTWKLNWFSTDKMELLKKVKPTNNTSSLLAYIKNLDLWWFSSQKIENANISNFSLKENKNYWLEYQVNLEESKIFINKNIEKWSQTLYNDNEQTKNIQLKITDFPTDWELLTLSKNVINKYKIDLTNYWTPVVNNDWRDDYNKSNDKNNYYLPDTIQVIYPLILNWKNVYEDYGAIKWLIISFDAKTHNLAEVNWIEWLQFESSNYPIENDPEKVNELIKKWWRNSYTQYHNENTKVKDVTIHLSVPKLVYININNYNNWTSTEYYVPAYIFESIEKPKAWEYFQEKVIIPLIKDFFNSNNQIMR